MVLVGNATEDVCSERGCCWVASNTPQCFYPSGSGYEVDGSVKPTDYGYQVDLKLKSNQTSPYGNGTKNVRVDVMFETQNRLRIKVGVASVCVCVLVQPHYSASMGNRMVYLQDNHL